MCTDSCIAHEPLGKLTIKLNQWVFTNFENESVQMERLHSLPSHFQKHSHVSSEIAKMLIQKDLDVCNCELDLQGNNYRYCTV